MPIAKIKLNIRYHFAEMIRNWSGRECIHRKIVEDIDDQGNIIDRSTTEETIYALIGNQPFNEKVEPIGSLQSSDLCLYYWYNNNDDDIIVSKQITPTSQRHDEILFQGTTYWVANLEEIAFDLNDSGTHHEPIFAKYKLSKVAPS